MAVKYNGLLRFTDEIKAEIDLAADGTVEKAVIIDGEGAETPIGGGASDFTTAEVTITNNTGSDIEMSIPAVRDDGRITSLSSGIRVLANTSKLYIIAMYKGNSTSSVKTDNVPTAVCTGDISIGGIDNRTFYITGNGTITFGTAS